MKNDDVFGPVPHYNGAAKYRESGWEKYRPEQIESALWICKEVMKKYSIRDIVRHDDISIGRKTDTGPALSLEPFTKLVGNRSAEKINQYRVNTPNDTLNVRDHYSSRGRKLTTLDNEMVVYVMSGAYIPKNRRSKWWLVSLDGFTRTGFVNSDFLEPFA